MSISDVPSPITGQPARLVDQLDAATVCARYRESGVDVSSYIPDHGPLDVYQCPDTGYRFFHPPSLAGEADFYEQLYDPTSEEGGDRDYRAWSDDYQYAFERIAPGERLLVSAAVRLFLRRADQSGVTGITATSLPSTLPGARSRSGSAIRAKSRGIRQHIRHDHRLPILSILRRARVLDDLVAMVKPGGG